MPGLRVAVLACLLVLLSPLSAGAQDDAEGMAWNLVRESTDASVIAKYLDQFPGSPYAAEARTRLNILDDRGGTIVATPEPAAPEPEPEPESIALLLQRELQRVGCYPGGLDGNWGPRSRRALADFSAATGRSVGSEPGSAALDAVRALAGQVCAVAAPAVRTDDRQAVSGEPAASGSDISGRWQGGSGWGTMTLAVRGTALEGSYRNGGRIVAQLQGRSAVGRWAENVSRRRCDTAQLGSNYWGTFRITFDAAGRTFSGAWSYCDESATAGNWNGSR